MNVKQVYLRKLGRFGSVKVVSQGDEGKEIKQLFPGWSDDYWENSKSYEELKNELTK